MSLCVDCQKPIGRRAKRCPPCGQRNRYGNRESAVKVDLRHRAAVENHRWLNVRGYHYGNVDPENKKKREALHRFVWFLEFGKWPEFYLDHVNGDKTDNRIENLRPACKSLNARNYDHKKETSLPRGVRPNHNPGSPVRFSATIRRHGRSCSLGTYATASEASVAYENAREIVEIFEQLKASELPVV